MKRWYVDLGTMYGGHREFFFFKSSAFKRAEEAKTQYPIIYIRDRLFKKTYNFRVPTDYPIPIVDQYMRYTGEVIGDYVYEDEVDEKSM